MKYDIESNCFITDNISDIRHGITFYNVYDEPYIMCKWSSEQKFCVNLLNREIYSLNAMAVLFPFRYKDPQYN